MAGINFIGSYSGVDQTTIDKLMAAEKLPLNQLTRSKIDITAKQNAWKDVNTRLNSLFEKLKALQSTDTFNSMTTKSSNDSIISASASSDAVAGKYDINVTQLASNSRVVGADVVASDKDVNKALGFGLADGETKTLKIMNGADLETEIEITNKDSLKTIVNKINNKTKDSAINATIIDNKLVLSSEKAGDRSITFDDNSSGVIETLGLGTGSIFTGGQQAEFTINGIAIKKDSNTVKDVALGLTIDLNEVGKSTINVATDTEKLTKVVQDFVDQYNSTMAFIGQQLAAGKVTEEGTTGRGTLAGDSSLRSLQASLRTMVTASLDEVNKPSNTGTSIKDISALGVKTTDKSGVLSFDSLKLLEQFSKDPQSVINFFSYEVKNEKGDDVNVGFISKLNTKINTYISSSDGLIKSKSESLDRNLRDLNKRIDIFNDRMVRKEAYYKKMFSALDVAMMQAESQMEWLNGQVSAMNASSKK